MGHDLDDGLRLLRLAVDTHLVTSHAALPLLIREPGGLVVEMTDGPADYDAVTDRVNAFYDPRYVVEVQDDGRPAGDEGYR